MVEHAQRLDRFAAHAGDRTRLVGDLHVDQGDFGRLAVVAKQLDLDVGAPCRAATPYRRGQIRPKYGHALHPSQSPVRAGMPIRWAAYPRKTPRCTRTPRLRPPRCPAAACAGAAPARAVHAAWPGHSRVRLPRPGGRRRRRSRPCSSGRLLPWLSILHGFAAWVGSTLASAVPIAVGVQPAWRGSVMARPGAGHRLKSADAHSHSGHLRHVHGRPGRPGARTGPHGDGLRCRRLPAHERPACARWASNLIEGYDADQLALAPDMFVVGNVVSRARTADGSPDIR